MFKQTDGEYADMYVLKTPVASLGSSYYLTLAEAIGAATQNSTAKLLEDTTESIVVNDASKELTINLNGKKWESNGDVLTVNAGKVTIDDLTEEKNGYMCTEAAEHHAVLVNGANAQVTVKSGYMSNKCNEMATVYVGEAGGKVTIEGGLFMNSAGGQYKHNEALKPLTLNVASSLGEAANDAITVNGGSFYGNDPQMDSAEGVYGAPFVSANHVALEQSGGYFEVIEGGTVTFDANGGTPVPEPLRVAKNDKAAKPTDPTKENYAFDGWTYDDNGTEREWNFDEDVITGDTALKAKWVEAIASVTTGTTTTYYDSLAAAVNATAGTGSTIKLLKNAALTNTLDIEDGKDVTLDLADHSISADADSWTNGDTLICVNHGGKLTVGDSSDAKTGTLDATTNSNLSGAIMMTKADGDNSKTAELVLNNGTIRGTSYGISGKRDNSNASVTINGGSVIATGNGTDHEGNAIYQPQAGALTVNAGTLEGWTAIYAKSGTVTINGGELRGTGSKVEYEYSENGCKSTGDAIVLDGAGYTGGAPAARIKSATITFTNGAAAVGFYVNVGKAAPSVIADADTYSLGPTGACAWVDNDDEETKGTYPQKVAINLSGYCVGSIPEQTYTGMEITPNVTVKESDAEGAVTLTKGTDYTVAYEDNTNVGNAKVTITGTGNYTGTIETNFAINEKDAANVAMTIDPAICAYTGNAKTTDSTASDADKVTVTLKDGEKVLEADKDYDLNIENNVEPGTATVTATFKGNYKGTVTGTFRITKITVENIPAQTYAGAALMPAVTVMDHNKTLTKGTDYDVTYQNNNSAGTGKAKITFKGTYAGTDPIEKTFTITSAKYTVTFDADGGSPAPAKQTVEYGAKATAPKQNPTKSGYAFISWQLNGKDYNFATRVTSNVSLKAKWAKVLGRVKITSTTVNVSKKRIAVKWKKCDGATSYQLRWREASATKWTYKTVTGTNYTITGLAKKKCYIIQVCACNAYGAKTQGAFSDAAYCYLWTAQKVKATSKGARKATVKWKKLKAATGGFVVSWSLKKNMSGAKSKKVSAGKTSYTISKLKRNKTYYVRVTPIRKVGGQNYTGAPSTIAKVKVR